MPSMRRKPASSRSSPSRQAPNLQAGVRPVPSGEQRADAPTAVDASGTVPAARSAQRECERDRQTIRLSPEP